LEDGIGSFDAVAIVPDDPVAIDVAIAVASLVADVDEVVCWLLEHAAMNSPEATKTAASAVSFFTLFISLLRC